MANLKILGIDQTTGQGRYLESTDTALNIAAGGATIRILTNPGGTSYTQVQLQALYDGQTGLAAPARQHSKTHPRFDKSWCFGS